jgi:hypothetical protein
MRQTAYLILDKSGEPQFVETDERNAQVFARALGHTVTETFYDLPDPDTWERIEQRTRELDELGYTDEELGNVADLIDRCKKLAGVD